MGKTASKTLAQKFGKLPIFSWKVRSKSNPKTFHRVDFYQDGHWECDCISFSMNRRKKDFKCRHIRIVENYVQSK